MESIDVPKKILAISNFTGFDIVTFEGYLKNARVWRLKKRKMNRNIGFPLFIIEFKNTFLLKRKLDSFF
jgi:hypothetical protein